MNSPAENDALQIETLDAFRVPVGNQAIELQQIRYPGGGMPMLRLRIRERTRFTIFDIDPLTAAHWAESMQTWAAKALAAQSAAPDSE